MESDVSKEPYGVTRAMEEIRFNEAKRFLAAFLKDEVSQLLLVVSHVLLEIVLKPEEIEGDTPVVFRSRQGSSISTWDELRLKKGLNGIGPELLQRLLKDMGKFGEEILTHFEFQVL